jgi:hypothetical protein
MTGMVQWWGWRQVRVMWAGREGILCVCWGVGGGHMAHIARLAVKFVAQSV